VESKYVPYIDLQHEIVDHLASSIEEKQIENPSLSFDLALSEVYSKFPITGFTVIIGEKSSALKRFWIKIFLAFMLRYLKLPKIAIAGCLIYLLHIILHYGFMISPKQLYYVYGILVLASVGYRYNYGFEFSKEFREKHLVTGTYLSFYGVVMYFYIPLYSSIGSSTISEFGYWQSWILSDYLTSIILLLHAYTFVFPMMLKKELQEKYSHINIKLA
jgi:hypothetical protein